jgi:hypothetical protein
VLKYYVFVIFNFLPDLSGVVVNVYGLVWVVRDELNVLVRGRGEVAVKHFRAASCCCCCCSGGRGRTHQTRLLVGPRKLLLLLEKRRWEIVGIRFRQHFMRKIVIILIIYSSLKMYSIIVYDFDKTLA